MIWGSAKRTLFIIDFIALVIINRCMSTSTAYQFSAACLIFTPCEAPNVWSEIQSGCVIIFINNAQGVWLNQMNRLDSMINNCLVGSIVVSLDRML